jgi:hypothetical protein
MPIPGTYIVTAVSPVHYAREQLEQACAVAHGLSRGRFVLMVPPAAPLDEEEELDA